jgi:hypothetical protein
MKRALLVLALNAALAGTVHAQAVDPNPAMNNPDETSWELFVLVNKPAATPSGNNVVFETWASNDDTFQPSPTFPGAAGPPSCGPQLVAAVTTPIASPKILNVPALEALAPQVPGLVPHVVPGGAEDQPSEEVRRNESTFNFIVCNKLQTKAGLRSAFTAGQPISFPEDSIEVKANWKPAGNRSPSEYHINTASDGKRYALVSMHIISKKVPNWTWATFEQKDNLGRCDYLGCHDSFGATVVDLPAHSALGGRYDPCVKTAALKKMFADAGLPALWENYCLKGSQVDFTTATGVPTRLGNSVTESVGPQQQDSFVVTSSCMTCHSRSAVSGAGRDPYGAGFITSPNPAICPPSQVACSPNGPPNPAWFWSNLGQPTQSMVALQTDFIFSLPQHAIGP